MIAAVHNTAAALNVLGWVLVLGCLAAAAYCAWVRNVGAMVALLVVAMVAAVLLL